MVVITLFIYDSFEYLLVKVLNALCAFDSELRKYAIEPAQWIEIKHLLGFFRPFAEVTTFMSGQNYPTISSVIVFFNHIMDHLDSYKEGKLPESKAEVPDIISEAAMASYEKIKKYYNKTNMIYCVVTLLDPRCNVEYFKENEFEDVMINEYIAR